MDCNIGSAQLFLLISSGCSMASAFILLFTFVICKQWRSEFQSSKFLLFCLSIFIILYSINAIVFICGPADYFQCNLQVLVMNIAGLGICFEEAFIVYDLHVQLKGALENGDSSRASSIGSVHSVDSEASISGSNTLVIFSCFNNIDARLLKYQLVVVFYAIFCTSTVLSLHLVEADDSLLCSIDNVNWQFILDTIPQLLSILCSLYFTGFIIHRLYQIFGAEPVGERVGINISEFATRLDARSSAKVYRLLLIAGSYVAMIVSASVAMVVFSQVEIGYAIYSLPGVFNLIVWVLIDPETRICWWNYFCGIDSSSLIGNKTSVDLGL